jgi:hypothetical protein
MSARALSRRHLNTGAKQTVGDSERLFASPHSGGSEEARLVLREAHPLMGELEKVREADRKRVISGY